MSTEKHWLVHRDKDGLRRIEVFEADEQDEALRKYEQTEKDYEWLNRHGVPENQPHDCCLFGADSLATLVKTHASWFAPETCTIDSLLSEQANALAHEDFE